MKKAIQCGLLFDATSEDCLRKDMTVVIDGNVIIEIVPTAQAAAGEAEVINLSDKFVMPGLIDGHVHIMFNRDPGGRSIVYTMTAGELALKSLATAQIDLMAGFTTLRVMSAVDYTDVAVKRSIAAGYHKGPRLFCSGEPLGCTSGNGDTNFRKDIVGGAIGQNINGPYEARHAVRTALKAGVDQIKLSAANSFLDFSDNTGAPEMTLDEMAAAVEIAHMNHKITAAHTYDAKSIENAVLAGVDTIEHCVWVDDDTLDLMLEKGTYMVPTAMVLRLMLENAERFNITGKRLKNLEDALAYQLLQISKARQKGIKIAFGSDAGTPFNIHGMQAREFKLMVDAGLRPAEALLTATKVNARMIGWQNQIGSIEVGKFADIVAFDRNPLEDMTVMQNCSFVMKDGEVFKK